jgi:iron complex transport system substrate-binding protein
MMLQQSTSRRRWLRALAAALLPLAMSAAPAAPRVIHYYGDRTATVPATVQRIACGWPAQNSILAMLGYGDRIVATTDVIKSVPLFRKFVPSIDRAVYCFSAGDVHMEELLKARPELIFVPRSMLGRLEVARRMGIEVVVFKDNSLPALVERTLITGQILGPDAYRRALAYQRYYDGNVARIRRVVERIPAGQRVRVYHCLRDPWSTAGANSLVQDWMDLAGATNVAEPWFDRTGSNTVNIEQVLKADPDVILAMNAESARQIRADARWSRMRAVKDNRVYVNPKGLFWWCRETTEEALQILWLAKTLYPERFRDVDMRAETKGFYRTFYGFSLTDAETDEILHPN